MRTTISPSRIAKEDVIIRGGETLSSREIEDHIAAMDSVAEVACIAVPDRRHGEKVCAIVRLRSGTKVPFA